MKTATAVTFGIAVALGFCFIAVYRSLPSGKRVETNAELDGALEDTFPASDPVNTY